MKKVFASDFDGTLYFSLAENEENIPSASVRKIREYQDAGNLFGLCTGRPLEALEILLGGQVKPDFYITGSGANIADRDLKTIQSHGISLKTTEAVIREMRPKAPWMMLDAGGKMCVFRKKDIPGKQHLISRLDDCPPGLIHCIRIECGSQQEAEESARWVYERFSDEAEVFCHACSLDITPRGCSKGIAVNMMRRKLEEEYGEVRMYGIGNSLKDLPLLEACDVTYTFTQAPEELHDEADIIVETIAEALEHSMKEAV